MKKILYIISVLLLTIFLKNNVYGSSASYSTVDELYNHINTIDGMTYVRKIGDNAHDTLKNSDLFISTKNSYSYYVIFGSDVFFFNYVPTVPAFFFADNSVNVVYLSLIFDITNVKYAKFSFNLDTGVPTSSLSEYYVGSNNTYLTYGPAIGFYNDFFAKDDFYNLFDSNFDLVYRDTGTAVVQKKSEFSFIPTYSENYETCNLKLDIKNAPDYYTLEYAINSSTSTWYTFDNSAGITVEDNCLVIVRMLDENGDEILANSYNIANIVKKPEFSFIPTYSENYETCNLKLDIKNAPDYYTLEYAINSSTSTWYIFDNVNGLTVNENCMVIVRMVDSNGDELFANSYTISNLGDSLSKIYFNVDFSNPYNNSGKGLCYFKPVLYNNSHEIFDIYCSVESEHIISMSYLNKSIYDSEKHIDWFKVNNNGDYGLHYYGSSTTDVILKFKLVNKITGVTALTRTFNLKMNLLSSTIFVSSGTNGENDVMFDSGASNAGNPLFSENSLTVDWSAENSSKLIQSFFDNIVSFFNLILAFLSLMPGWITVPIYTLFTVSIFLFVYKFFRG